MLRGQRFLGSVPQAKVVRSPKTAGSLQEQEQKRGGVRTGFSFAAEAGQQKKNCHRPFWGMQTDEDAEDKANALCFALLRCFTSPSPSPAGVASRCERMRYVLSQDTFLYASSLHCVPFWGGLSFRSGGVAGQASLRDTVCAEGKRMHRRRGKGTASNAGHFWQCC